MARTLNDCLDELKRGGAISDAEFARIRDAFEERRAQHRLALGDDEAARRAGLELEQDMIREAAEKRRRAALTVVAQTRLKETLQTFRRGDGKPDINEAAMREVQRIEHRKNAIEGMSRGMIADMLDETRRTKLGGAVRNKALVDDVIRAWHGDGNVSEEARGFAAALDNTFEWLRQRFNDAGGAMGKLDNYGGPHYHDARALRRAKFEGWRDAILPRLDAAKTGLAMLGRPMAEGELRAALPRIFETIVTEGWNNRNPQMRGGGSLASRGAEPRMLHFKSGDDWLAYNRDFGAGEPYHAIMAEISRRSRDIAAMEVLGPNPDGMIHWMQQVVEQQGAFAAAGRPSLARRSGDGAEWGATYTSSRISQVWENIKGASTTPVSGAAEVFGTLRSLNVASKLGGATLSALGDLGTSRFARSFNDIGGTVLGDLVTYLGTYKTSEAEARRAGLMIDSATRMFDEQSRYVKSWAMRETADWLADRTLALSGLTPWTNAARHTFGFGFFAEVADHQAKAFNDIPEHLRAAFQRHGMTDADWNVIRLAQVHAPEAGLKAGFIRPADVLAVADGPALPRLQQILGLTDADANEASRQAARGAQETATKYLEMVLAETELAVPTGTARARTLFVGKTRPGSVGGEALRAILQFRSWPITFAMLWGQRIADQMMTDRAGGSWHKALTGRGMAYGTGLMLTMTMFGALSMQLKNIRAGRDPESMDPSTKEGRKFYAAAIAQGGGFSLLGDFLFADHNRFGGSLGSTFSGAIVSNFEQVGKTFLGPIQATSNEKATKFGSEILKLVHDNLPGGNIWYLDLAAKRMLFDNMQRLVDPDAEKAFTRQVRNRRRERNQEFWWAPGDNAPARAPDPAAVMGR